MKSHRFIIITTLKLGLVAILLFSGCSGHDENKQLDSDLDGLLDSLETQLGSNPYSPDSDGDELTDGYEAFGSQDYAPMLDIEPSDIVNIDGDSLHAIIDSDDNGDGVNDGYDDHDGDGLPNAFEYYGFTYNKLSGELVPINWQGESTSAGGIATSDSGFNPFELDSWIQYYKTDPTMASTDGDPYTDYEEIMGQNPAGVPLDPSVILPGTHPLIPAYPDISVSVTGVTVTPNADITSDENHLKETAWSENIVSKDRTVTKWKKGTKVHTEVDTKGPKASVDAGVSKETTHTVDNTVTTNNSTFTQDQWSKAISTNTLKSASISFQIKVKNVGTAVAKNVTPTFSLMVGSTTIMTISNSNSIDILTAKGTANDTFPASRVDWVIPEEPVSDDNTVWLSIDQLKSIQNGAPFVLEPIQIQAQVMGLPEGQNDWNDYKAKIETSCAKVYVDLGDGNVRDYLVWAPRENPWSGVKSGPDITVRDAIMWVTMARFNADKTAISIPLDDGSRLETTLEGWRFGFDEKTFNAQISGKTNLNLWDVPLSPDTVLVAKAPPQGDLAYPKIYWANLEPKTPSSIKAYVDDYFAVESVFFYPSSETPDNQAIEMRDINGDGIFEADLQENYEFSGTERVVAANDEGRTSTYDGPFVPPPDQEHISGGSIISFDSKVATGNKVVQKRATLSLGGYGKQHQVFYLDARLKKMDVDRETYVESVVIAQLAPFVRAHYVGQLTHQEYLDLHESQIKQFDFELNQSSVNIATLVTSSYGRSSGIMGGSTWALSFEDGTYAKLRYANYYLTYTKEETWSDDYNYEIGHMRFEFMVYKPD